MQEKFYFKAKVLPPNGTKGTRIKVNELRSGPRQTSRVIPWDYENASLWDHFPNDLYLFDDGDWAYFERQ